MVEEVTNRQDAFETFRPSAEVYAHDLFNGAKSGTDLPESLRNLIALIPDLDENDGRWRWSFDSLATNLQTEPEDISEKDIGNLQRMTAEFITGAQTPEHKELAAQIIFLQQYGPRYKVPEGENALDNLEPLLLKLKLRGMTVPQDSSTNTSIMGPDVAAYAIAHATVSQTASDEAFIAAIGDTLTQIQNDMREMGAAMPEGNGHGLIIPADVLPDSTRLQILEKAMAPLGENDALTAIRAEADVNARIQSYTQYIASTGGIPDADKSAYTKALDALAADKPVLDQLGLARDLGMMDSYTYNRHLLSGIQEIGLDRSGRFGDETKRYLDAYLDYMTHDNGYGTPGMRTRAAAFAEFMDMYNDLPETDRIAIEQTLDHDSGDPPGIKTTPSPDQGAPLSADEKAQLSPAQLSAIQVLGRMGESGNVPSSVIDGIANPQEIAGLQHAHLDEAFQQSMQAITTDNFTRIYGIRNPAATDTNDRIGGDDALIRFWFDSNNNPYEFKQQQDGNYTLHKVDPWGNVDAAPVPLEETPMLFEYHVQPDGKISKYLLDNGQLFSSYADLSPVMLEGQYPDFDIHHPNFVTTRFLDKMTQTLWNETRVSAGLEDMGAGTPDADAIDAKTTALDAQLTAQLQTYFKDRGEDPSNQQISDLVKGLKSGAPEQEAIRQKLGAQNDAQRQSSDAIMTLLVQLNALNTFRDTVAARDYSRYMDSGALPGGLGLNAPQTQVEWQVNWGDHIKNGELKWRTIQEGRVFTEELTHAYDNALKTGGTVNASLFQNNAYAASYIEQQGWDGAGQLDYIQTSMIGRTLMLKESADRHGIADPNSAEAKAAFVEDFRDGQYHWHDIEMFMRSFDADQQRLNAKLESGNRVAMAQNQFDYGSSVMHRSEMFNELFGTDVALTDKEGNVLATAENATITRDDAVKLFWQSYAHREEFGYDKSMYHLGYDEMVERHGAEFAQSIEHIMESRSLFQQFMMMDANNPEGDQKALYERRYMANVEDRIEKAVKREYDVIPEAAASPITEATLDPDLDVITGAADATQPDDNAAQPLPDATQPDDLSSPAQPLAPAAATPMRPR